MSEDSALLDLARHYIEFFNRPGGTSVELSAFLAPEIVWQEMPNKFAPAGRTTRLDAMLKNFQTGQKFIAPQTYIIDNMLAQGDTVALQLSWKGTAAQALGPFAAGEEITCRIASFLTFREGRVVRQVDYPCYPPSPEPAKS